MDYVSQLENLLSLHWQEFTERVGAPHDSSCRSQPIRERLSEALSVLEGSGRSHDEATRVARTALIGVLGRKWEEEVDMLLQGLEGKRIGSTASAVETPPKPVGSRSPFGKGRPSTGFSTHQSTPTLAHCSDSLQGSSSATQRQALEKYASSGNVTPSKKQSNTSRASLSESGYNSLESSTNCANFKRLIHQRPCDNGESSPQTSSKSCPPTPQHSVTQVNPSPSHTPLAQSQSLGCTPTTSAVSLSPRPASAKCHRDDKTSSNLPVSRKQSSPIGAYPCMKQVGTQVSRLSELQTVPETDSLESESGSCLELQMSDSAKSSTTDVAIEEVKVKLDSLHEKVDSMVLSKGRSSPAMADKAVQTPEGTPERPRGRVRSEGTAMIRKKTPKLGTTNKAHSAGDADSVMTEGKLLGSYSPLPSLRLESGEETDNDAATSTKADDKGCCVQEDLTKEELLTIASQINPNKVCQLSCLLHKSTHVCDDLRQRFPQAPSTETAFRVLQKWFENISSSPENRRTLVIVFQKIDQLRLSDSIARKTYTTC